MEILELSSTTCKLSAPLIGSDLGTTILYWKAAKTVFSVGRFAPVPGSKVVCQSGVRGFILAGKHGFGGLTLSSRQDKHLICSYLVLSCTS